MSNRERWHVLGAGAMGCMLAQRLAAGGQAVTLLHHRQRRESRQLISDGEMLTLRAEPLGGVPRLSIRRLLLTTKAGQLAAAVDAAAPFLATDAVLLTTANGLGFEAAVARRLPGLPLHRAVSTAAAYRDDSGVVHAVATGQTRVGTPGGEADAPSWFRDSLADLKGWNWEPDIATALGEKFAVNCVINALTAVHRCRNGDLLVGDTAGAELAALCAESEPALRGLGLWQQNRPLLSIAVDICRSTAQNQSSMLQDVLADRPTEIDYLNGELLRRAEPLGLALPRNRALVAALRE